MIELKNKLIELKEILELKNNKSFTFFEKLISEIEENQIDVINTILKSTSIIQYGNFDAAAEKLFNELWELADRLKNESDLN